MADYSTHSVDVEYEIDEGTQYTIGEVYISGNRRTKDYVIRRELPFETDDLMDTPFMDSVSRDSSIIPAILQ